VLTGLLACKPNKLPPGCVAVYKLAVESANVGRLNAFAVFAFCAEITRLPGHWSPRALPVNATAHTIPSRLTTVPHMLSPKPPFQVHAGDVKSIPMSSHDFSVPDFGICSPDPHLMERQFFGISCKFALRQPQLTHVSVRWHDSPCSAPQPDSDTGVEGDAWNGTLDNSPADFGITSVWSAPLGLSNPTKVEGNKVEPRHLCPGTPVTFTQYNFVRRLQYNFAIPDFRFPNYHPEGGPVGGVDIGITAK
jgi:hypothetical protein